jgi:subtilisin family serine protease
MMKLLLIAALFSPALPAQTAKKRISKEADLPRFSYPVSGKVEELLNSDGAFKEFSTKVRKDIVSVFTEYEIDDAASRRRLLRTVVMLDLLEGNDSAALAGMDEIRALEEKPGQKLTSSLVARAMLDARKASRDRRSPQYRQAFYRSLRAALGRMPYNVVQNEIKQQKASAEITSENLIVGQLREVFDPVVSKTGALSSDLAFSLPGMRYALREFVPVQAMVAEALGAYLAGHAKQKPDIWAAREVTLEPGGKYSPVTVAVWDTGVDAAIFKTQLATADGKPLVIAYDIQGRKAAGELMPFDEAQWQRLPEMKMRMKGWSDLQANVDTPEATSLKKTLSQLKPEQVKAFIEELTLFSHFAHGTHVAGILVAGNPYARIVTARMTFDHKLMPDPCPSREFSARNAAAFAEVVDFLKETNVRVVNMSWGGSAREVETALERCGTGGDAQARKKLARELFDIESKAMHDAMATASGILFVVAAGNSNSDASFDEYMPVSFKLPNVLAAGAVDRAGDEAPFTSYGPTVTVHANGYEVNSYVPGGEMMKFSGTSMASPNVANLAAKILAVNPKLKPAEVAVIICETAEKTEDGRRFLIHPKNAIAMAKAR